MTTDTVIATITPEEEMAHTAQAKMLREARDELAQRATKLAQAKNRKGLERMGLSEKRAKELIAGQPFTYQDLADLLGVKLPTLRGWLSQKGAPLHAGMPLTAKLLLTRILADKP